MNLDFNNPADVEVRDMILRLHGQSLIDAKKAKCKTCWYKENGRCNPGCDIYAIGTDPIEASKGYLSRPNNVQVFPFVCKYVVPIYEKTTGDKGFMDRLKKQISNRWKKEHPDSTPSDYT